MIDNDYYRFLSIISLSINQVWINTTRLAYPVNVV